jgi:hypothetical protein
MPFACHLFDRVVESSSTCQLESRKPSTSVCAVTLLALAGSSDKAEGQVTWRWSVSPSVTTDQAVVKLGFDKKNFVFVPSGGISSVPYLQPGAMYTFTLSVSTCKMCLDVKSLLFML